MEIKTTFQLPANPPACLPYKTSIPTPFGYRPSLSAGIIFIILFATTFALHVWQTTRHRNLWLGLAFSIGAFGEFAGWIARTVAYRCPYSVKLLEMQLASLIMAPAFTTAGIYGILSLMIPIVGRDKSPLHPKLYLVIFMIVDFFSGLLQAIGGGLAGAAFSQNTNTQPGTSTMVAGIIWQLVSTCVFVTLFEIVMFRAANEILRNTALMRVCAATMLSVTCMVIRGVYRSMELVQGWRGHLFTHERYAIVLDAVMMFMAVSVFNIWNPALLLPEAQRIATATAQLVAVEETEMIDHNLGGISKRPVQM